MIGQSVTIQQSGGIYLVDWEKDKGDPNFAN